MRSNRKVVRLDRVEEGGERDKVEGGRPRYFDRVTRGTPRYIRIAK